MAHGRISVTDISLTLLTDMCFTAMHRLFPEYYIRHNIQSVYIESQPKYPGCSNKIAELSNVIYSYFKSVTQPSRLCCWRFPDVQLVGAARKFDGGTYFGICASELLPTLEKKCGYKQRKAYAVRLAELILECPECLEVSFDLRAAFKAARKRDDYSDSLLLAGIAFRDASSLG